MGTTNITNTEFFIKALKFKKMFLENVLPQFVSVQEKNEGFRISPDRVVKEVDGFTVSYGISSKVDEGREILHVTPVILEMLGITEEELHQAAVNNIEKEANLMFLNDMLKSMGMPEELAPEPIEGGFPMNIVTTNSGVRGAAAILSKEVQEEAYEKCGENYYILPSSVHEIIVVPESAVDDPMALKTMVKEVNEMQVPLEEQLSENVWFYDGNKIKIIA